MLVVMSMRMIIVVDVFDFGGNVYVIVAVVVSIVVLF